MPKDIRYLCKRRKNQLIKSESHSSKDSCLLQSIVAFSPVDRAVDNSINFEISYRNVTLPKDQYRLNTLLIESHERENKSEESNIESGSSSQESENEADNLTILTDVTDCMDKTTNLRTELRTLIIENNISHNTVNKLFLILRKYDHVELPNDVQVLLQTPRNASINFEVIGDHYVHFELFSALERSIQIYWQFLKTKKIKFNLNIDGLPLFKSSGSVLASI